ncbi:MAG: GIY-YIG nuclease family protein [Candidatus Acidiferrales bacterium]
MAQLLYPSPRMDRTYCVYILASRSRNLYVGVTNNLERRLKEHRDSSMAGFTKRYRIFRLVDHEVLGDIRAAIAREKEIKGWRREKKLWLINRHNPHWEDLAQRLADERTAEKARIQAHLNKAPTENASS